MEQQTKRIWQEADGWHARVTGTQTIGPYRTRDEVRAALRRAVMKPASAEEGGDRGQSTYSP